jgi:hypothetical protein
MKYLTIFMILAGFAANAQTQSDPRDVVMYDPLFWRSELSLRHEQSRRIEEINVEFYQNLREIKEENANRESKTVQLEQGLQERSQKIFRDQNISPTDTSILEAESLLPPLSIMWV